MAGSKIKMKVDFSPLLESIKEAGGDVDAAAVTAAQKSADVIAAELRAEAQASSVPTSITNEITQSVDVESGGNRISCSVGWDMPTYNPRKPAAGYKAVFLNYGTPKRKTRKGANRGKIEPCGFIARAKRAAAPKVKKAQRKALQEILRGLEW